LLTNKRYQGFDQAVLGPRETRFVPYGREKPVKVLWKVRLILPDGPKIIDRNKHHLQQKLPGKYHPGPNLHTARFGCSRARFRGNCGEKQLPSLL
jgi:hypothetical protein